MVYNTSMFMGSVRDELLLNSDICGFELFNEISRHMRSSINEKRISAKISEEHVKSGGWLSPKFPMLVISNSDSSCKFFDIGICVNGNILTFPLLGESAENTKANKKKILESEGKYFRAALINPDMFKLQQESLWRMQIMECFNEMIE